jgi:hypothetical protein
MNYFPENEIAKTHPSVNENSHPIDAADRQKVRPEEFDRLIEGPNEIVGA